jgi:hypothetical protein
MLSFVFSNHVAMGRKSNSPSKKVDGISAMMKSILYGSMSWKKSEEEKYKRSISENGSPGSPEVRKTEAKCWLRCGGLIHFRSKN